MSGPSNITSKIASIVRLLNANEGLLMSRAELACINAAVVGSHE